MKPRSHKVLSFIFRVTQDKSHFFGWLLLRIISAVFPLITIYQFSHVIKLIETKQSASLIFQSILYIFIIRIIDNVLRLKSITRLEHEIANISFDIHNFFLSSLKLVPKKSVMPLFRPSATLPTLHLSH